MYSLYCITRMVKILVILQNNNLLESNDHCGSTPSFIVLLSFFIIPFHSKGLSLFVKAYIAVVNKK